jgi:hypothetical protein
MEDDVRRPVRCLTVLIVGLHLTASCREEQKRVNEKRKVDTVAADDKALPEEPGAASIEENARSGKLKRCFRRSDFSPTRMGTDPVAILRRQRDDDLAFPDPSSVWKDREIRVCWMDEGHESDKAEVRSVIAATWGEALNALKGSARVTFTGWDRCSNDDDGEVRIAIRDQEPRTVDLGRRNDTEAGGPNVYLNFALTNWQPTSGCRGKPHRDVIRTIAAHEFGHVLGLAHEQNRSDDQQDCADAGRNGTCTYCAPDAKSIMHYCRQGAACVPDLSECDRAAIVELYTVYR